MANEVEVLKPMNFGTIKDLVGQVKDRGGDSSTSDTLRGVWVNAAEKFVCSEIGAPHFLEYTDTIVASSGSNDLTFPVNVKEVVSLYDKSNLHALVLLERAKWDSYIVDPSKTTGLPAVWTKWGYSRRANTESPAQEYGQFQVSVWPTPSSDTTLSYTCILRPGCMVHDSDFPVVPIEYHYGLVQLALMMAGPHDIGVKAYAQNRELAMMWLRTAIRADRRNMSGNDQMVHVASHSRRNRSRDVYLTRRGQLGY